MQICSRFRSDPHRTLWNRIQVGASACLFLEGNDLWSDETAKNNSFPDEHCRLCSGKTQCCRAFARRQMLRQRRGDILGLGNFCNSPHRLAGNSGADVKSGSKLDFVLCGNHIDRALHGCCELLHGNGCGTLAVHAKSPLSVFLLRQFASWRLYVKWTHPLLRNAGWKEIPKRAAEKVLPGGKSVLSVRVYGAA